MVRLFLLSRERPAEMTGIECGELIEEEVEEIWWLGNSEGRMGMGKVMLLFITLLQATEYLYVRIFVVKHFLIVISVSDIINVSECWDNV